MQQQMSKRGGYILLVVLVLIAIAAIMLASIARQSLLLATDAVHEQEDLQKRWGIISCQKAIGSRANAIIQSHSKHHGEDEQDHEPDEVTSVKNQASTTLALGNLTFELLLADEQAKVNLNTVYHERGKQRTKSIVSKWIKNATEKLPVRLKPFRASSSMQGQSIAFDSWGQVFDLAQRSPTSDSAAALAKATSEMTCWGNGRLNLNRATDRAIIEVCRMVIGRYKAKKMLELWRTTSKAELDDVLASLRLQEKQQERLGRLLTDESKCHSLWIRVRAGGQNWYSFHVLESIDEDETRISSFVW